MYIVVKRVRTKPKKTLPVGPTVKVRLLGLCLSLAIQAVPLLLLKLAQEKLQRYWSESGEPADKE